MKILLTNDDGINSEGLQKLAEFLQKKNKYKVFTVAPDKNRSGISHGVSIFSGPVSLNSIDEYTWSCSGFPVDCILTGLNIILPEKPDIVLSGINRGANLGTDIIFSGTAAAARQASLKGIPAIALSLVGYGNLNWDMAVSWSVEHLEKLLSYWREGSFVNVNIPNSLEGPNGYKLAWPAVKHYKDSISIFDAPQGSHSPDGDHFCFIIPKGESVVNEAGSDCDVVSRNFVSVSPIVNQPVILRELCPTAPDYAAVDSRGTTQGIQGTAMGNPDMKG